MNSSPRKILAIKLRALGDTVIMTAALDALRRAFPQAEIHAAVLKPWVGLLEGHPSVDRVWSYEKHKHRAARAKATAHFALEMRKQGFDCVVNFHASPSSAMIAFATGARVRSIHFHGHHDKNRYSTVIVPGKGTLKPIIERDLDTIRALGVTLSGGGLPSIHLRQEELSHSDQKQLVLSLGASRPTKCWPIENFAQIALRWVQTTGGPALAVVGPGESSLKEYFNQQVDALLAEKVSDPRERAELRTRISARTDLSLRCLAVTLKQAAVVLGNDSGPKHLAIAVGTPTVTLFGPEHPFEWHPYSSDKNPYFFIENLPCRKDADLGMPPWCSLEICTVEKNQCMRKIDCASVFSKVLEVAKK